MFRFLSRLLNRLPGVRNLPFEWQVGLRYTRAGRRQGEAGGVAGRGGAGGFLSFIAAISMAGIALGVAALIVVLSVMNGFQKEVRDRMLSVLSHVEVFGVSGGVADWQALAKQTAQVPEVLAAAPYVAGQAMLTRDDTVRGALIRGILPDAESKVSDIASHMKAGRLTDLVTDGFGIVLGSELARALGVFPGDKVTVVAPQGQVTPAGLLPRLKQFTVVGIFESGHFEYDSTLALTQIDDAARLFRLSEYTGVRLRIADLLAAPEVSAKLSRVLSGDYLIRDWTRQNRNWFAAVQTEKRMMFIILTLIIAVAAFNLVSTLVMTVTDKQADIAILRTLGAAPRSIQAVFIIQGAAIGVLGCALGVGLGVLVASNIDVIVPVIEHLLGVQFLPKDSYFINTLPSDLRTPDVAVIGAVSLLLSLVATLYPSWRAARVQPAHALRYE